ncbi:MAG: uroporphyrinogen decarboxylase family protein [Victivallaceae bacterium]|nr:uroporphyrinogen decarboxylase family protein [Victivallaceae bacterium]
MKKDFRPDFEQLLKVLCRERPDRPVQFEFYMNRRIYEKFGTTSYEAFFRLGYDYATVGIHDLCLPTIQGERQKSVSQNSAMFENRKDFEAFSWRDPDPEVYKQKTADLPTLPVGGKYIGCQPQSVLGGLVTAFGYENLCLLCYDDPELVADVAEAIGKRLIMHADMIASQDCFGAMILNDDWGFNAQTRLAPEQMRQFIIPWYVKMVEAVHSHGKPTILHSCGNMWSLIDDICDVCKFDGKHSYEDKILPVEEAYRKYSSRIAIVGGIDVDFLSRKTPREIKARADALLEMSREKGAYVLGSGNSIPEFVPDENYLAMLSAAWERR